MKRSTVAITVLVALLVASNAFWAYVVLDGGISYTYLLSSYDRARGTALQALAVSREVGRADATRQSVIDAALQVQPDARPFEKEGFVWVGDIGLRFDDAGQFMEARPAVEPF
jgi:hypothetical protein